MSRIASDTSTHANPNPDGLRIEARFCPPGVQDPFDTVEWETRSAAIKGENGEILFEQTDCEIPRTWSQLATNVVVSKYFYGENGTSEREHSVRQLIHRVTRTIADWGMEDGYFASAGGRRAVLSRADVALPSPARRLQFAGVVQRGAATISTASAGAKCNWHWDRETQAVRQPENPYEYPQGSACFIQSVDDNMEDIMRLATSEAMLFKFGSGTGTDLSTIRSHREKLSGGGSSLGSAFVHAGLRSDRGGRQVGRQDASSGENAVAQGLASGHHGIHRVQAQGGAEGSLPDRKGRLRSQLQWRSLQLDSFPECESCRSASRTSSCTRFEQDREWTTHWVTDPSKDGPRYPARQILRADGRVCVALW